MTMINAQAKQFKLSGEGHILYQTNPSNPLPGVPIAVLKKGAALLEPVVELLESCPEREAAPVFLAAWLQAHIAAVLEPLVALANDETLQGPVKDIAAQVYAAMGTLPREHIEPFIAKLDQDTRRVLRGKKIRLGPILVFQPDLNKPAAVHLRALLWTLFNDKPLPAAVPPDGVVSFRVDASAIDPRFYQAVGYPVFGPRAIRIDMLDRVISAVYDSAEGGKFKAQHQMAEWLGCPIDDLYQVLTAMGHSKVHDPADQPKAEEEAAAVPETAAQGEAPAPAEQKPAIQAKPELATFRLKKGKAFEKPEARKPRPPEQPKAERPQKPHRKPEKKPGKRSKDAERPEKIMSAGPKARPEDSPFAILQQLKVKKDGN